MHAEVLVKALGAETTGSGTWAAGLAAVRSYLTAEVSTRAASGSSTGRASPG